MPPSPSLRRSPVGDSHKRGRSLESGLSFKGRNLESGLSFKERDDDLALFSELQTKDSDNFLLQSNDGFEDMLCNFYNSYLVLLYEIVDLRRYFCSFRCLMSYH